MPRIRAIKPEYWADSKIAKLSHSARLLYIGVWNFCDDEGRMRAAPAYVRSMVFPYDEPPVDTRRLLDELSEMGRVVLYEVEGEQYLFAPFFTRHQKIDHASPSRLPAPVLTETCEVLTEASPKPHRELEEASGMPRVSLAPDGDGDGESETETYQLVPPSAVCDNGHERTDWGIGFAEFYAAFPKHTNKEAARSKWVSFRLTPEKRAEIMDGLRKALAYWARTNTEVRFIPNPAKWLHQKLWTDDYDSMGNGTPPQQGRNGGGGLSKAEQEWNDTDREDVMRFSDGSIVRRPSND